MEDFVHPVINIHSVMNVYYTCGAHPVINIHAVLAHPVIIIHAVLAHPVISMDALLAGPFKWRQIPDVTCYNESSFSYVIAT